jgi:hypothetical protein
LSCSRQAAACSWFSRTHEDVRTLAVSPRGKAAGDEIMHDAAGDDRGRLGCKRPLAWLYFRFSTPPGERGYFPKFMSELRAIPLSEFLKRPLPTLAQRMEQWGGWKPHRIGEITYPAYLPGGTYPIDLETLTSSEEVPDMICQVAKKEWATSTISCTRKRTYAAWAPIDGCTVMRSCG